MKEAGEGLDPEVQIRLRIVTISGPSEVRNLPRFMQQQVSGRIWVRTQVSQSCPYYMQGTVLGALCINSISYELSLLLFCR